jgi:membrane protein
VMLGIVVVMVAVLYYATPNVRQPKFRWVSIGAAVAILVWVLASIAFGFYVSNFSSYNKTYGSLAGIIVFLLWLWITNLALLFGAEIDAELERARELQSGIEAERTLQLPPRDTRNSEKAEEKLDKRVAEGRRLRLDSEAAEANDQHDTGYETERAHRRRGASGSSASAHELEPLPSEQARAKAERRS